MTFKFPGLAHFISGMLLSTGLIYLSREDLRAVGALLLSAVWLVIARRSQ